jgi:hypothetical protein
MNAMNVSLGTAVTVTTDDGSVCSGVVSSVDDRWLGLTIPGAMFGAQIPRANITEIVASDA